MPPPTKIKRPPPLPPRKKNFVDRSPPRPACNPPFSPSHPLVVSPSPNVPNARIARRRYRRVWPLTSAAAAATSACTGRNRCNCSDRVIFNSSPRARINIYLQWDVLFVTSSPCNTAPRYIIIILLFFFFFS